jgi:hypothetical protein
VRDIAIDGALDDGLFTVRRIEKGL